MNQWKYVKLGEVCTIERGGSPRPIDDFITTDENGINWIKIGDADESMYITKTAQRIKPEGMKKSRYVKPGDFLLSNSMSFGRPYILKIDGCIHDGWLVLRDENNVFDKKFLYYYLSAPITYKRFKSMAVGGVVNNLNSDMVRKVRVPIPSQEEQHQISDRLDKVSNLIFLRKQQLAKLDELVKARFVEMFGESEYPCNSLISLIIEGAGLSYGIVQPGDDGTGDMGVLRPVDFADGKIKTDSIKYIDRSLGNGFKKTELNGNELLITVRGTTGITALTDSRFKGMNVTRGIAVIRYDEKKIDPIYLNEYLKMEESQQYIKEHTRGATLQQINLSDLRDLKVMVPPLLLQQAFSTFVERVDQQKQTVQQSLEKLELMKKALMQEYFG